MLRFILKRIGYGFLLLIGVITLVFFLFTVLPSDPARVMMGQRSDIATEEAIRKELGLDLPIGVQYLAYLNDLSPISWHKTKDTEKLRGKRILVQIKQVKAFGDIYDALRIAPTIPAEAKAPAIKCPRCGKPVEAAFGMTPEELIKYTKKKYGEEICAECAKKEAENKKGDENDG